MKAFAVAVVALSFSSCKNTFDISPDNVLERSKMYQDVNDADAVIIGIYGKLTGVMDRYVVLNELRGDLLDITPNADKYLRQLNEHNVSEDNPWADPKPFYSLILSCNDAMKNFKVMLDEKRLTQAEYDIRYSEVATVWCWVYLQLGIQYGSVPFVTEPLEKIEALQDKSKYPVLTFEELLDKLTDKIQTVAVMNPIQLVDYQKVTLLNANGASLIRNLDGYSTPRMFLNRHCLFGDIYLWKNDYPMASRYLKRVIEYGDLVDPGTTGTSFTFNKLSPSNDNHNEFWDNTFTTSFDNDFKAEIITNLPFDRSFKPANPFIKLFSKSSDYLLKPSALAIDNWNKQVRSDNLSPIDIHRGLGNSYTGGAMPEVRKFLGTYDPLKPFETNGKIVLYRAAGAHLHFAESANRDGRDQLAYALINSGIRPTFSGPPPTPSNVKDVQQSIDPNPDYYFDGRSGEFPVYRGAWYRHAGVRGHVSLAPVKVDSAQFYDMSIPGKWDKPITNPQGLKLAFEDIILNESALEMAFEGVRWPDLLRIALRREKEFPGTGTVFLRDKVAAKFTAAGQPIPQKVMNLSADIKNWYLPFKW